MIPADTFLFDEEPETEEQPSLTYKMDIDKKQIRGFADELEAMKQAVYKILLTERYQYIMYSWDYGIETLDLYGEPVSFVYPPQKFFVNAVWFICPENIPQCARTKLLRLRP